MKNIKWYVVLVLLSFALFQTVSYGETIRKDKIIVNPLSILLNDGIKQGDVISETGKYYIKVDDICSYLKYSYKKVEK